MKAELVPDNGDPPIPIVKDLTLVGRRDCCDVMVDDPSISKRHCVFVKTDGLLVVRDLCSTNGTKVKGQRVRWAALLPDDRISLGAYKFRVYLGPDDTLGPSEIARNRKAKGNPPELPSPAPQADATYIPSQRSKASQEDSDLDFAATHTPPVGQDSLLEID